jgi:hypothetical protein
LSQNSVNIPNTSGLIFRTNLNNALDTINTNFSGASAPSSPVAGMSWYDTINNKLWIRNSTNTTWVAQTIADFVGSNVAHSLRNSISWLYNADGSQTGALQIKITGLYAQTLSGGMRISITQNNGADGIYVDYVMHIAGNWRSSDHTWHNTKAIMIGESDIQTINVRFCSNATDVFIVIGEVGSVWYYPRLVVESIISNAIIGGYTPDFNITKVTSLPTTTHSTIAIGYVNADISAII